MMESDINADQNFYRRPHHVLPSSSSDHDQQQHHDYHTPYNSPPTHTDLEARSPKVPPKLPYLTTQNLHAVTSNGYVGGEGGGDPDDFYKQYRGVQSSSNGYGDSPNGMAATVSESRPGPSSLRSNSNGTTPKHPPVSGLRNGLKQPGYRSASSPLDGRTALSNAKSSPALNGASNSSQKPSVKDLLKRFDQNNQPSAPPAAPAVPAVRKPAPRIPPKDVGISSTAYARTRATNSSSNTLGSTRAGQATRDTGVGAGNHATVPRTTQRTRFATEDQHSNNALSSTARTTKPRIAVPGSNGFASKSMSNLSPSSQTHPQSPPAARRPLFGEVSSTGTVNLPDIGYNVTGQTNIRRLAHSRSRSEIVEAIPPSPSSPSSPTAWYRSVNRELGSGLPQRSPRLINGHNRAHSDSPDAKANPLKNINTSSLKTGLPRPSPTRLSPHTRIATATSRFNTPSSSSSPSPPSTRAVSPYAAKSAASTKLRKPEPRSTTPTAGRAQTPTSRTPRGKARSPGKVGTNNASLKAYISSPPPKTSPPLRSSRPRQPVSSASTASSRQKTRERSQSAVRERAGSPKPVRTGMRVTRTNSTPSSRDQSPKPRRILTSGPVDFAARREKVQRAYTKSIHASEQKEIRARNLQRLNERRAVEANSKKETEALTAEKAAPVNLPTETSEAPAEPLQVTTNFSPPNWTPPVIPQAPVIQQIPPDVDSPTLGIPGSFPGEKNVDDEIEEPQSAISNATGVTEIDVEPQTAPAQMSVLPSESSMEPSMLSQEVYIPESSAEITPQLPEEGHEDVQEAPQVEVHEDDVYEDDVHEERDGHDDSAIPIFLDATPAETSIPSPLPSPKSPNPPGAFMQDAEYVEYEEPLSPYDPLARDPSPPGAFQEESPELTPNIAEHDQPVFATTITSASPLATPEPPELQVPREHPEARTPPESGDEREFVDDTIHAEVVVEDLSQSICSDLAPAEYESPTVEEFAVQDQDEDESKAPHLRLPMLRSALSAHRDSDYLMTPTTDIDYESSNEYSSVSGQRDTSQTQNRDQLSPGMYYDKRQSVWTDFSVNSGDEFSDQEYYEHYPLDLALTLSDPEKKPVPPPKTSPVVPPKPNNYTPQASPRFLRETPHLESPHQLPPVSTDTGLGLGFAESTLGYGSQVTSVVPLWPEYTPPPVPVEDTAPAVPAPPTRTPPPPSIHNRGPSSSIHRSSQYESRRPSEDVYSPRHSTSTPRSSAQMSAEDVSTSHQSFVDVAKQVERLMTSGAPPTVPTTAPNTFETEEDRIAAEKEKKRLYQRMRIIKELIETEAVYLKDMNVVEEIYKGTAEACPKLEETDVKSIFRNTDEVVAFTTTFLDELKAAGSSVFTTRKPKKRESQATNATANRFSTAETLNQETDDQKDRKTFIGRTFGKHLKQMQEVYTDFLKNSEIASTRLTALQADPAVKVWLQECNLVAKDLTAAWSLDALLVKPVQRITRYKLLLADLSKHTTENHPDYQSIQSSMAELDSLLKNIDDLKRRIDMVGKIVGRKRKESDVRSGIAKAFGRRAEKLQSSNSHRPNDDETYLKLHEKYQDDYLRLQVVLRDVEFYTRQSSSYVNDFLRYLSSIELVMRLSASPYPEIESKWARFNMGMRDMGTVALEEHLQSVRQRVIQPFEQVIQAYSAPGLAMKKRNKRRLDYEKSLQLKNSGKKIDEKLSELVDQYEALNETLKFELPKLSQLTEKIGNICLGHFVSIQAHWFNIWQEKVKVVLEESQMAKEIGDIVDMFARDYKYVEARAQELGIVNGTFLDSSPKTARASQSTRDDGASMTSKGRPSNISSRSRGLSIRSDTSPSLPTPDFAKRNSGQFTFSPILSQAPGLPAFAPRDPSFSNGHSRAGSGSPATPNSDSPNKYGAPSVPRPGTGRSFTSNDGLQRPSNDYNEPYRRQSGSTYNSNHHIDGPPQSGRPYSGLFHSAMPLPDGPEDSQRSSRASSRDRNVSGGYNVLYLAASLFEFNISATKSEAGYPYLTYQAGEIFDVIGEKGELWLAKNQDDPMDSVGWIWSKHFARLATD